MHFFDLMPCIILGVKFQAHVFFWVRDMKPRRKPPWVLYPLDIKSLFSGADKSWSKKLHYPLDGDLSSE